MARLADMVKEDGTKDDGGFHRGENVTTSAGNMATRPANTNV